MNAVDALEKQPVYEAEGEYQAGIQPKPEPALELGAGKYGETNHGKDRESTESDERIWKTKDGSLLALHNAAAANNRIEIT